MISSRADFTKFFICMYLSNLALTGVGYTFFYMSKSLPLMHATAAFTLLVVGIPRVATIIAMMLLRPYSDIINKQKMSLVLAVIAFITFFVMSFAIGKFWLILLALLYGFTLAGQGYLSAIVLDRTAPEERMKIFGYFATSSSLSSFFGAALTEVLYPLGVHSVTDPSAFRSLDNFSFFNPLHFMTDINPNFMMLAGAILGVVWIISSLTVKACEQRLPFYGVQTAEDRDFHPSFWGYKTPMLMTLLLGILWMSLMSLIPSFTLKIGVDHSSVFFMGFAILAVLGRFIILPKMPQWGRGRVIYLCFVCYIISIALILSLPVYPSQTLLFIAGLMCGLGHGVLFTSFNIIFTEVTPKHTGNATFMFLILFYIGCLLVMPLGVLVDHLGYNTVFIGLLLSTALFIVYGNTNKTLKAVLKGNVKG